MANARAVEPKKNIIGVGACEAVVEVCVLKYLSGEILIDFFSVLKIIGEKYKVFDNDIIYVYFLPFELSFYYANSCNY